MKTEVISKLNLDKAVESLKNDEPVIFPTETVYGLGGNVFSPASVEKIFQIKKRPLDNPLIVHIALLEDVKMLAKGLSWRFFALVERFWPGPLTLVLQRKKAVPSIVSSGLDTVAIRMPSHSTALMLIEAFGKPLVAPSANFSGRPSPTRLVDALEDLDGMVAVAIDGGDAQIGIESSVLGLYGEKPVLLRPGSITKKDLEEVLKEEILDATEEDAKASPGMRHRHYAPKASVELIFDPALLQEGFIVPEAASLYRDLRQADREGRKKIQIFCDERVRKDSALMNRLLHAAGEIVYSP